MNVDRVLPVLKSHPTDSPEAAAGHPTNGDWKTVKRSRSRANTYSHDAQSTHPSTVAQTEVSAPTDEHARSAPRTTTKNPTEHYLSTVQPQNADSGTPDRAAGDVSDCSTSGFFSRANTKTSEPEAGFPRNEVVKDKVLKLSPARIDELTKSPESLALTLQEEPGSVSPSFPSDEQHPKRDRLTNGDLTNNVENPRGTRWRAGSLTTSSQPQNGQAANTVKVVSDVSPLAKNKRDHNSTRPSLSSRTVSTPPTLRKTPVSHKSRHAENAPVDKHGRTLPTPLNFDTPDRSPSQRSAGLKRPISPDPTPSPMPQTIPLPPLSVPTYLQLELSSSRPSPLYIHRSITSDFPYESSKVKFDRLLNFLLLPPQLEQVLWFGALACLDAWLYTFTILPLRFFKALAILGQWWGSTLAKEISEVVKFVYKGLGRMRRRHRGNTSQDAPAGDTTSDARRRASSQLDASNVEAPKVFSAKVRIDGRQQTNQDRKVSKTSSKRHRRMRSVPSLLLPDHKADLLKGLVVLFSCLILMRFDASRMYHGIRGQAAIKLYVIYNVLEVCDRLFSALGQDVFECLFSRETLERKPDGRSKILRPFGMFLLALAYNVIHSTALFYQVITLNVAVNSYSNALMTLLMSNQFVEIKSTVFKKFEKENLFQLTCADVVERFQLWLMLMIIAMRNIVEVGGLSLGSPNTSTGTSAGVGANATAGMLRSGGMIPKSFTIFPKWTGQVLGPFLLVLGSEMLVDWLKHAYITKFNNTKPAVYGRFLDVLAKDYYSNAFGDQNLTRRLGLPVIPLSCLFIRASLQTYQMFVATNMPPPLPSTATSLSVDSASTSPATTAALHHFDTLIWRALGRSPFGSGATSSAANPTGRLFHLPSSTDDFIALFTMLVFFLAVFLILLACKLVLGMILLGFARSRYKTMKERETGQSDELTAVGGRRVGGWGVVEVDDDKKRCIYSDDPDGARAARDRERAMRDRAERANASGADAFGAVSRYSMVAKRIW